MDEDYLLLVVKVIVFAVICVGAGMLLAHWMIWG